MPGAYAHLTLVALASEPSALEAAGVPGQAIAAMLEYSKYVDLGAVSPDYPYLSLAHREQKAWADSMHYELTRDLIAAGISRVRALHGEPARKCLAWLLGYAAHVTTDMTIHPVVEKKVGPYHGHEREHRICEMHQDTYIFERMNLGGIQRAEYLHTGVAACSSESNRDLLDENVTALWSGLLRDVYADSSAPPPDPHSWHRGFRLAVDKVAESGRWLVPIARHVAQGLGLVYPLLEEVDPQFIKGLEVPGGGRMDYDDIFDRAVDNVRRQWALIANEYVGGQRYAVSGGTWNLDTGRDGNRYVFWEVA